MLSQHIKEPAVEQLHANGVHFVLCRAADEGDHKAKSPIGLRWQKQSASLEAVLKHRAAGGLLGFVPGKSGLLVIDVDKFPTEDRAASALVARLGILPLADLAPLRPAIVAAVRSQYDGAREITQKSAIHAWAAPFRSLAD